MARAPRQRARPARRRAASGGLSAWGDATRGRYLAAQGHPLPSRLRSAPGRGRAAKRRGRTPGSGPQQPSAHPPALHVTGQARRRSGRIRTAPSG
jgi:hypothetical protein